MGWVVSITPRPLYPREIPGTRCRGGRIAANDNNPLLVAPSCKELGDTLQATFYTCISMSLNWPLPDKRHDAGYFVSQETPHISYNSKIHYRACSKIITQKAAVIVCVTSDWSGRLSAVTPDMCSLYVWLELVLSWLRIFVRILFHYKGIMVVMTTSSSTHYVITASFLCSVTPCSWWLD